MAVSHSGLFSSLRFQSDFRRNLSYPEFQAARRIGFRFQSRPCSTVGFKVHCERRETDEENSAEEPPELLFMKELRKRRMISASVVEESNGSKSGQQQGGDLKSKDDDGVFSDQMNAISTDIDESLSDQRNRSMALNSEGLEGLIPRAKLLLGIGGTFFIGFWPFILITLALFSALSIYFGESFLHDASKIPISSSLYVNSYRYLEDVRISETIHHIN